VTYHSIRSSNANSSSQKIKIKIIFSTLLIAILSFYTIEINAWGSRSLQDKIEDIELGMTQKEIMWKLGKPAVKRGAQIDKDGRNVVVFEYIITEKSAGLFLLEILIVICTCGLYLPFMFFTADIRHTYWLYFADNKLLQWGKPGDWKGADVIYDVNIKSR